MNNGLVLNLSLDRGEGIYGESIFFSLKLTHTFKTPVSVTSLEPANRAVTITLKKLDGEERKADQMSSMERDGFYIDTPRDLEGTSLAPGDTLELRGDLLKWFGHIPAGTYKVLAEYKGIFRIASCEAAELKIMPASILAANTPRWGSQLKDSPLSAAWAHSKGQAIVLFYQQQSPYLPRNPWLCIRTVSVNEQVSAHASCIPSPECLVGHLYWFSVKDFFFVPIDLKKGRPGPPIEVKKLPFGGWPIGTALSLKDGSFVVMFADYKRLRCAAIHVQPTGVAKSYELDLGRNTPIGPNTCFFEQDQRLHVIWTKPKGRQIDYAMLPLDDMDAGFATRTIHISNDPVLWFDAYMEREIPVMTLKSLYLGEKGLPGTIGEPDELPAQKTMVWCVSARQGKIVCTPISTSDSSTRQSVSFSISKAPNINIISSAVSSKNALMLLLCDESGELYYASTTLRTVKSIKDIIGLPITQNNCPSLMAGTDFPWVHLRFVMNAKMINYIRLEPENEPDPVESETMPWQMEPDEEAFVEDDVDEPEEE
ncbi:MAG TPA: hypothetical protein ENN05_11210 [Deltaproteobacteria bacterium]|nr:hypothetical protein [Deltaproteobacteria bacterium]